ncbi:MAG: hypothetical protein CMF57_04740 [Leifsonia sp.]|nr:hypothetical protein [Leifsonia sp.]
MAGSTPVRRVYSMTRVRDAHTRAVHCRGVTPASRPRHAGGSTLKVARVLCAPTPFGGTVKTQQHTSASPIARLLSLFGAILLAGSLLSVSGARVPAEAALGTIGTPDYLGDAESFAVVAGTEITNAFGLGPAETVVDGDMAVSPGTVVTGFGTAQGVNDGTTYTGPTGTAAAAKLDADAAWTNVDSYGTATPLAGAELGGQNLGPGVYTPPGIANFGLTGTLTLTGDWDDIFVFKSPSFSTANDSVVVLNGANPCNIYWRINESAALGANTTFVGTLLAGTSITVGSETDVEGRLFAGTGNVTLIHDQIATPTCLTAPSDGDGAGGGPDGGAASGSELADTGVAGLPVIALGSAALVVLLGAALAARGRRSTLS